MVGLGIPAVLMDKTMVVATGQDQVLLIGVTKIRPMPAVMAVDEMPLRAAGESTAPIPDQSWRRSQAGISRDRRPMPRTRP
jgi:hypothetical protein